MHQAADFLDQLAVHRLTDDDVSQLKGQAQPTILMSNVPTTVWSKSLCQRARDPLFVVSGFLNSFVPKAERGLTNYAVLWVSIRGGWNGQIHLFSCWTFGTLAPECSLLLKHDSNNLGCPNTFHAVNSCRSASSHKTPYFLPHTVEVYFCKIRMLYWGVSKNQKSKIQRMPYLIPGHWSREAQNSFCFCSSSSGRPPPSLRWLQ